MAREAVKRICGNCGHQWIAAPPVKAPSKIGFEADNVYANHWSQRWANQRSGKFARLQSDYEAKLNASYSSKAAFDTCVQCGSTGGIRTEYSPAQAAAIDLQQRMNRRLLIAALTFGMSEAFRFIVFSTKLTKKAINWLRVRRASSTD